MDMQARNTGRAKTLFAPVGSRTCVRVEATMNDYGVRLQDSGVTAGLGLGDKFHTCHLKCLIYQTLILAAQCGKLLAHEFFAHFVQEAAP